MKRPSLRSMMVLAATMVLVCAEAADIPPAKEGKGLVVFYRESSVKGGAVRFQLNQGQEKIAKLK